MIAPVIRIVFQWVVGRNMLIDGLADSNVAVPVDVNLIERSARRSSGSCRCPPTASPPGRLCRVSCPLAAVAGGATDRGVGRLASGIDRRDAEVVSCAWGEVRHGIPLRVGRDVIIHQREIHVVRGLLDDVVVDRQ